MYYIYNILGIIYFTHIEYFSESDFLKFELLFIGNYIVVSNENCLSFIHSLCVSNYKNNVTCKNFYYIF